MNEYEDTHVVVSEREALISTVSYNIMATNDLACATVIFALFRLRKSPFYRFRVKQLANKVELERSRYEKVINAMMADSSAKFADSNDIFMDAIQDEIDALFNSIKSVSITRLVSRIRSFSVGWKWQGLCVIIVVAS